MENGHEPVSDIRTRETATTALAEAEPATPSRRGLHPALIVLIAIGAAVLLGWIFAGLPGLPAANALGLVLLVIAALSGTLTLVFVIVGLRKASRGQRLTRREVILVITSSLITGSISLVQLVQTIQQLTHR